MARHRTTDSLPARALWVLSFIVVVAVVVAVAVAGIEANKNAQLAEGTLDSSAETPTAQAAHSAESLDPELAQPAALAGVLATPGAAWTPGTTMHLTTDYPEAGVPFQVSECTVAFSFSDSAGTAYAVTASHCGSVGDLVWPTDASTVEDYSAEVGRVIYSDLDDPAEISHDIGIIEITDPMRMMTFAGDGQQPSLVAGGERFADPDAVPPAACKIGGASGLTCGETGPVQRQQLYSEDGSFALTEGATASICATQGDSGGPIVGEVDGVSVVLGLLSGTRTPESPVTDCEAPGAELMTVAYTPAETIVETIHRVVPEAVLPPADIPAP